MKKILIGAGLALTGLLILGAKKTLDISSVLEKLQVRLGGLQDIDISRSDITATIDIIITNPTARPLDISVGSSVRVTKIFIYDRNGNQTAYAEPNLEAINVAPFGETVIRDIPVRGTFGSIINTLFSGGLKKEDFTIKTEVEALGRKFII